MNAVNFYHSAKLQIIELGYAHEIEWQASQEPENITEQDFLREAAWVVYCSGFKEAVVRQYFDFISLAFCDWSSAEEIVDRKKQCIAAAMFAIKNKAKHEAVAKIAERIAAVGFQEFMAAVMQAPVQFLQQLPFIGPVTSIHLAKNLGFDVAKPDRHLIRLHSHLGFSDVNQMCEVIALESGDPVKVVDLVLWRFIEQKGFSGIMH